MKKVDLYPTVIEKCTRIGFSLVCNHPFVDGNKRIGLLVMITCLEYNEIILDYTNQELIEIGLSLASGDTTYEELLDWVITHETS